MDNDKTAQEDAALSVARDYYDSVLAGEPARAPVSEDIVFTCPFPTVRGREGFLAALGQMGSMTRGLRVETRSVAGPAVVTVGELDLASGEAVRFAETLRIRDGVVHEIDLIMDPARLTAAASGATHG